MTDMPGERDPYLMAVPVARMREAIRAVAGAGEQPSHPLTIVPHGGRETKFGASRVDADGNLWAAVFHDCHSLSLDGAAVTFPAGPMEAWLSQRHGHDIMTFGRDGTHVIVLDAEGQPTRVARRVESGRLRVSVASADVVASAGWLAPDGGNTLHKLWHQVRFRLPHGKRRAAWLCERDWTPPPGARGGWLEPAVRLTFAPDRFAVTAYDVTAECQPDRRARRAGAVEVTMASFIRAVSFFAGRVEEMTLAVEAADDKQVRQVRLTCGPRHAVLAARDANPDEGDTL